MHHVSSCLAKNKLQSSELSNKKLLAKMYIFKICIYIANFLMEVDFCLLLIFN